MADVPGALIGGYHAEPVIVGLLRKLRNLDMVRLQQISGGVINRRDGDLIRDLGLQ